MKRFAFLIGLAIVLLLPAASFAQEIKDMTVCEIQNLSTEQAVALWQAKTTIRVTGLVSYYLEGNDGADYSLFTLSAPKLEQGVVKSCSIFVNVHNKKLGWHDGIPVTMVGIIRVAVDGDNVVDVNY
jgi:hypothetical protein